MVRTILGLMAGAVIACLALFGGYYAKSELHPPLPGVDLGTPGALAEFATPHRLQSWPAPWLLGHLLAWPVAGSRR